MGMKWGVAMLDPAFRPVTAHMIDVGDVDAGFSNVPANYSDTDTLKVVIMMGDGANTYEYRFGSDYRGAGSDLWEVVAATKTFWYAQHKYKAHKTSNNPKKCKKKKWVCFYKYSDEKSYYYLRNPNTSESSSNKYYDIANGNWLSASKFNNLDSTMDGWESSTQLKWEDAWNLMPANWYDSIVGGHDARYDLMYYTGRNGSEGDAAMADVCNAARDQSIVIYTIGFETSSSTSAKLRSCASTPSHYYDAVGIQISEVFAQIAASIQKLKLTQ